MLPGAELPAEIWHNICSQLTLDTEGEYSARLTTLNHLSQSSKGLCAIAQPILWSCFTNRWYDSDRSLRFLTSSFDNPRLARYVKELELISHNMSEEQRVVICANAKLASTGPLGTNLPEADVLQSARAGQVETEQGVLAELPADWGMSQCLSQLFPNIQRFSFEMSYDDKFSSPHHHANMNHLANLREIYIQYWDEQDGYNADQIAGLLAAPSLQAATLQQAVDMDVSVVLPKNQSLQHLRFSECCLSEQHLSLFAAAFPKLRILEYHAGNIQITQDADVQQFSAAEFVAAAKPLMTSLSHLLLDLSDCYRREDDSIDDRGLDEITSFAEFTSLRHLHIDATSLFGTFVSTTNSRVSFDELLPSSLIFLCIDQVYKCFLKPFQQIAGQVRIRMPELTRFHVGFCEYQHYLGDGCTLRKKNEDDHNEIDEGNHDDDRSSSTISTVDVPPHELSIHKLPKTWQNVISTIKQADIEVTMEWVMDEPYFTKGQMVEPFGSWVDEHTCRSDGRYIEC